MWSSQNTSSFNRELLITIWILVAARQLGFLDANECPKMCKLAYEYLKNTKGCKDSIYEYFTSEADADSLYIELIEELDRCILSYFAFHWSQTSLMISQVNHKKN